MSVEIKSSTAVVALDLAGASLEELADTALDLECEGPREATHEKSLTQLGAYVPLILDGTAIGVGIKAEKAGCTSLASALMMTDDPEDLTDDNVADSIGEIANLLAGGVKQRLFQDYDDVKLGTPLILNGHIHSSDRQQLVASQYQLGAATVELIVLTNHAE